MTENTKQTILERHSVDGKFLIGNALLELDARIKTIYGVIDEVKEVLTGYSAWAEKTDERLQKIDPKIEIISEHEAKQILKG